jgi:signal transduction histidine kinase
MTDPRVAARHGALALVGRRLAEALDGIDPAVSLEAEDGFEFKVDGRWYQVQLDRALGVAGERGGALGTVSDVTEQRRAEEGQRRISWLLNDIGERLGLLLFVKNCRDLTFDFWGRGLEDFFGIGQVEILGKTGHGFFTDEEMDGFHHRDRLVIAEKSPLSTDEAATTRRGRRDLHTKKIFVQESEKSPGCLLGILEDITKGGRVLSERGRAYDEIVSALQQRDRLLSTVAHDLNNPLGVVSLSASSLLRYSDESGHDTCTKRHASRIARAAEQMAELVSELRNQMLLREGRLVLDRRPVRAEALLLEVVEQQQPLAEVRGIDLRAEVAPDLPPVSCDQQQISRVFANLIGNAIKFSPHGSPITVRASACDENVRFSVSDAGPGISPTDLPRVFEPYWQADATRRQGTGLGLSIAKGIVEAHGGSIGVESELGSSSTFFFTIPCARTS